MLTSPSIAKLLKNYLKPKYVALIFSFFASLSLLFSAFLSYQSLQRNLETSLTLQGISIDVVLQSILKNFKLSYLQNKREFFSDLLLNEKWEGVAFLAIYDHKGTIILHSNPDLIGQKIEFSPLLNKRRNTSYYLLKTGEKVFLYEDYIRLEELEGVLRIALHIQPVEDALSYAKSHLYLEFALFFLFLLFGLFAFIFFHKMEIKKEKIEELERWQVISKILLHEIKNPLSSIKGFAQYLGKKFIDEKVKKPLDIILRETFRIEKLLKMLYEYSYTTELEVKNLDLKELLEDLLATLKFIYPEGKIVYYAEGSSFFLRSDPDKLKSIITNLLENALTATLEHTCGNVYVTLKDEKQYYTITIKDEGPGIEEKLLPFIFEPFFTTKAKGTGLGLALVKKFCEELNIKINLNTKVGEGTEVWLKIPLSL